jgi:hypothetical protein
MDTQFFDANSANFREFNFNSREFVKMALLVHAVKAPEDWSTPRRSARFGNLRQTRQRLGVRWPSTAFPHDSGDHAWNNITPPPNLRSAAAFENYG